MRIIKDKAQQAELVQLEISVEKLTLLFESGLICAAEIRCLTAQSKQHISKMCLSACAKKISCNISLFDEFTTPQRIFLKKSV
ncbi:hypothetical protein [Psychromonas hadalis]|uniref:hypothetical protein n=1 Tax=Psychromonas hadalis TaxID=211669 RepID=UPI0003B5CF7E|nr:hypothetical protein [Psychromonas hadalis]